VATNHLIIVSRLPREGSQNHHTPRTEGLGKGLWLLALGGVCDVNCWLVCIRIELNV